MTLYEKLGDELKAAMKSGDKLRVETLRLLRAQLKDFQIHQQHPLNPEEEMSVLVSAAKRRRESIEAFEKAGRQDLVERETAELAVISSYLPQALTTAELAALIEAAVQETGATGAGDLGKVMGRLMPQVKGRADGKQVQQMVRERLA